MGNLPKKVLAPWDAAQVQLLKARQVDETKHPYTCVDHSDHPLTPTKTGWKCSKRGCNFYQDWVHEADLEPKKRSTQSLLEVMEDMNRVYFVSMIARVRMSKGRQRTYAHSGYFVTNFPSHAAEQLQKQLVQKMLDSPTDCFAEPPSDPTKLGLDHFGDKLFGESVEFITLESRNVLPEEIATLTGMTKYAKPLLVD